MMLYAIVGEDRPDSLASRLAARPPHVERLSALQDGGRLFLARPVAAEIPQPFAQPVPDGRERPQHRDDASRRQRPG